MDDLAREALEQAVRAAQTDNPKIIVDIAEAFYAFLRSPSERKHGSVE